jgi:hypothetical protein
MFLGVSRVLDPGPVRPNRARASFNGSSVHSLERWSAGGTPAKRVRHARRRDGSRGACQSVVLSWCVAEGHYVVG